MTPDCAQRWFCAMAEFWKAMRPRGERMTVGVSWPLDLAKVIAVGPGGDAGLGMGRCFRRRKFGVAAVVVDQDGGSADRWQPPPDRRRFNAPRTLSGRCPASIAGLSGFEVFFPGSGRRLFSGLPLVLKTHKHFCMHERSGGLAEVCTRAKTVRRAKHYRVEQGGRMTVRMQDKEGASGRGPFGGGCEGRRAPRRNAVIQAKRTA